MFFGGFSGATSFFPDKVTDDSYTPPIVLTDFQLSANPIEIGDRSPLQKSISYTSDLVLSHDQNIISLTFAALGYSNPATNRYRYKLENLQSDWIEVGSDRRQITYTTLPAGSYTFRVQGATGRGPWSLPGVTLHIQILPPWWATWWLRAICLVSGGVFLWMVYLSRLRQARAEVQARLGERLVERERIARELHDTLLQGFSGLALRFQAVLKQIPEQVPARQMMEKALDSLDQVLLEGRNRVRDLRDETVPGHELSQLLLACGDELAHDKPVIFTLAVVGTVQPLNPVVRDEAYRIGRELLTNAFQHSDAAKIELEITYDRVGVCLRVRDDGRGMDQTVLDNGRPGHWGLAGIRERAYHIGSRLNIWSKPGSGTEVELMIPAKIAYQMPPEKSRGRWIKSTRSKDGQRVGQP
jgi:signal transduction histidine kinase